MFEICLGMENDGKSRGLDREMGHRHTRATGMISESVGG